MFSTVGCVVMQLSALEQRRMNELAHDSTKPWTIQRRVRANESWKLCSLEHCKYFNPIHVHLAICAGYYTG